MLVTSTITSLPAPCASTAPSTAAPRTAAPSRAAQPAIPSTVGSLAPTNNASAAQSTLTNSTGSNGTTTTQNQQLSTLSTQPAPLPPSADSVPTTSSPQCPPLPKIRRNSKRLSHLSHISAATWIGVGLALGALVVAIYYGAPMWRLARWTALNDFRASCISDHDRGLQESARCKTLLADPAKPPPIVRRAVDLAPDVVGMTALFWTISIGVTVSTLAFYFIRLKKYAEHRHYIPVSMAKSDVGMCKKVRADIGTKYHPSDHTCLPGITQEQDELELAKDNVVRGTGLDLEQIYTNASEEDDAASIYMTVGIASDLDIVGYSDSYYHPHPQPPPRRNSNINTISTRRSSRSSGWSFHPSPEPNEDSGIRQGRNAISEASGQNLDSYPNRVHASPEDSYKDMGDPNGGPILLGCSFSDFKGRDGMVIQDCRFDETCNRHLRAIKLPVRGARSYRLRARHFLTASELALCTPGKESMVFEGEIDRRIRMARRLGLRGYDNIFFVVDPLFVRNMGTDVARFEWENDDTFELVPRSSQDSST